MIKSSMSRGKKGAGVHRSYGVGVTVFPALDAWNILLELV